MLKINPQNMIPKYAVYILHDGQRDIFIWFDKFSQVLELRDLTANPAFDITKTYDLYFISFHDSKRDAYNATCNLIKERGPMTELNNTREWNLGNKGAIRCDQTGETWRNQADLLRQLSIDQSTLSKHIKRRPGFATIKGLTYSRMSYRIAEHKQSVEPPKQLHHPRRAKWIKCDTTGQIFKTQREACKACSINPGQLSQHLQKHAGYKTVKGMMFSYVDGDKPLNAPVVRYPT